MDSPFEPARQLCEKGVLIAVPKGQKGPRSDNWADKPLNLPNFYRAIGIGANFGLLLGPRSGYIDVECDSPEAKAAIVELFGGEIAETVAWESARGEHRLFAWDDRFNGLGGSKKINGVEFRLGADDKAMQSLIPPSATNGFTRTWIKPFGSCAIAQLPETVIERLLTVKQTPKINSPAIISPAIAIGDFEDALRACRRIRMKDGKDGTRRLCAIVCRGIEHNLSDDQIIALVRKVEELKSFPESFDDEAIRKRIRDMEAKPTVERGSALIDKPKVNVTTLDLAPRTDECWSIIQQQNNPPQLFNYAGTAARIEYGDDCEPIIRIAKPDVFCYHVARMMFFYRLSSDGAMAPCPPPEKLLLNLLATPNMPLPVMNRIVEAPVFAPDRSLVTKPGYHAAGRTLYAPAVGFAIRDVSAKPSTDEINQARELILELFCDFPFTSEAERAHAIALMILPFVRDLIPGPTPFFLFEKPTEGTGGTLAAMAATYPAIGRKLSMLTEARDEEEWRKRVTSKLRQAPQYFPLDNIKNRLESPALASAITSDVWEDRVLGLSVTIRVPIRCVWIGTGNNPTLDKEIARRTLRIRLNAKCDRPWLRSGFRHPDLMNWIKENRAELVWAALTLSQAWIAAGEPAGNKILGMFEDFSKVMGGILAVAGINGFMENLSDFYESADLEAAAWRSFLASWWKQYGTKEMTSGELFSFATTDLETMLGNGTERSQQTRFGKLLSEQRDRVYELDIEAGAVTVRVDHSGTRHRANVWQLKDLSIAG